MFFSMLLFAAALPEQTTAEIPESWKKAVSSNGKFSFAMPAKPVEKEVVQKSPNGPVKILEYSSTSRGCLYKIEQATSPVTIPEDRREGALGATRDSIARKMKISVDKATTISGWPARELLVEAPLRPGAAPSQIAMLLCYVESDFYQVRVFALEPGTPPRDVRIFFDAFRPKKARPGTDARGNP